MRIKCPDVQSNMTALQVSLDHQAKLLRQSWCELNFIIEEYAREIGLSYTSLHILSLIYTSDGPCTQKIICQQTYLPRQTVNSIITGFYKQGWVELREMPSDRRNKSILLTTEGRRFASHVITKMFEAEMTAMNTLEQNQRTALIETTEHYKNNFRKLIINR